MNAWWSGREDRARVGQALAYLDAEVASNWEMVGSLLLDLHDAWLAHRGR